MRFARFTGGAAMTAALVVMLAACTSSDVDSSVPPTSTEVSENNPVAAEMQRLADLYYRGLACKEYSETGSYKYVEYEGSLYASRDRFGSCMTQVDVDTDTRVTYAAVAGIATRASAAATWPERATVIVDGFCSLYWEREMPKMRDNYDRLFATFDELYATGRTYSGYQYPYSFSEARQWCESDELIEPPMEESPPFEEEPKVPPIVPPHD